jgi:hypothetical protein
MSIEMIKRSSILLSHESRMSACYAACKRVRAVRGMDINNNLDPIK